MTTKLADLAPITDDRDNTAPSVPTYADGAASAQPSAAPFEASALAYKPQEN
ncbi:hypothetical protein HJA86_15065 [Rhizobium bangladeshense]|nr:hypothetical protein [Rhizobium bangladeshense]